LERWLGALRWAPTVSICCLKALETSGRHSKTMRSRRQKGKINTKGGDHWLLLPTPFLMALSSTLAIAMEWKTLVRRALIISKLEFLDVALYTRRSKTSHG